MIILRNIGALLLSRIIEIAVTIAVLGLITRYLGTELYGKYALVMNVMYVFITIINFGLSEILIRELSRDKEKAKELIFSVFFLKASFIIVSIIIGVGIFWVLDLSDISCQAYLVALLAGFLFTYVNLCLDIYIAYEHMWYNAILTAINQIVMFVLIILAIYYDMGIVSLFSALLIANLISVLIGFSIVGKSFVMVKFLPFTQSLAILLKYFLKEAYPIALALIMYDIWLRLDVFILTILRSFDDVALFSAPQRLVMRLAVISIAFVNALQPTFSRMAVSSLSSLLFVYEKSFQVLLSFILPVAFFTTIFSDRIVELFFGSEFIDASLVLITLIWMMVFVFINVLYGNLLVAMGKQKVITKYLIYCFLVNIIFDLLLIPPYGSVGAGVAKILSFGLLYGLLYYYVSRILGSIPIIRIIIRLLAASLIMSIILKLLESGNIFLLVVIGFSVYLVSLYLVGIINTKEIALLKEMFSGA